MPVTAKGRRPRKKAPAKKETEIVKVEEELDVIPVEEEHPLVSGLDEEEKKEFARLTRKLLPLKKRAALLCELATLTDTKRAPVALRAIQEINKIEGFSEEKPTEETPLFVLPANTAVAIRTFEPEE